MPKMKGKVPMSFSGLVISRIISLRRAKSAFSMHFSMAFDENLSMLSWAYFPLKESSKGAHCSTVNESKAT